MDRIVFKATVALIVAGLIPVVILIAFSTTITSQRIRSEKVADQMSLAKGLKDQVEMVLGHAVGYLDVLATNPQLIEKGVSEDMRKAEVARVHKALFAEITLLDKDGLIIESTTTGGEFQEYSAWFRKARDEGVVCISSPFKLATSEDLLLSVYLPVVPADHIVTRVIKASMPLDTIALAPTEKVFRRLH